MTIDQKEFEQLKHDMEKYDAARDTIIKESRDITKLSKQAIYSLHRGEVDAARQQLAAAKAVITKLITVIKEEPTLRTGGFSSGMEEYVEACAFLFFIKTGKLLPYKEVPDLEPEEYLGGLSDLTGELMRYAVIQATKRNHKAVQDVRDLIDGIYGQFVQFDFRNSELRKKYDSIKYNLQKVENVLYDMALNPRAVKEE